MTWERQRAYDFDDGKAAGKLEGKLETAQKLLELNTMTVEQIAYVTELPIEQIRELQKSIVSAESK